LQTGAAHSSSRTILSRLFCFGWLLAEQPALNSMSAPASNDAAAAAVAPATDAAAATPAAAAPAAAAAAPPAAPALSGTDLLTLKMIEKALATLNGHKAIAARGVGMLMRNLNGILFGPSHMRMHAHTERSSLRFGCCQSLLRIHNGQPQQSVQHTHPSTHDGV
jgi:hypothetical protein